MTSLEGLKIVKAQEMARVEKIARAAGASEHTFMENAGRAVAEWVARLAPISTHVILAVGKGNNGGDAYAAGLCLLEKGFSVTALHFYPLKECSPLCQTMHNQFSARGGHVELALHGKIPSLKLEGILVDGLTGTGFHGKAEGLLAEAIAWINGSGLPVVAIDIPSGLDGTTGAVASCAVRAGHTIFLELPKLGFFLQNGWSYVGKLHCGLFGLKESDKKEAQATAYLLNEQTLPALLPPLERTRHKYQAGYVLAIAGSPSMPGAAILSCRAAFKAGAGIVRLFHPEGMEAELTAAPCELIRQGWDGKDFDLIQLEARRAKTLFVGPGMGRTKEVGKLFSRLVREIALPLVVDADGLFFLAEQSGWNLPAGSILTPHHKEMERLLGGHAPTWELCQSYAEEHQVTVVLKGAPTVVFHPGTLPLVITRGDPGMATAGAGDVLTGIIAALLAQGLTARVAAALGAHLHGLSGELAAAKLTSYCITASDLIEFLPSAFEFVLY